MLILSNSEIERMLTMPACMEILRQMYGDLAENQALVLPRVDNIVPSGQPDAYYAFKHMGGVWPRHHVVALRLNSDTVVHPVIGTGVRRVKVPVANGRWVGLVQLFSTETGELLAMFPDGVAQRMRVGATSGLGVEYLARKDARRAGLIGSGWQAGAQLAALLAARSIEKVKVYSTRRESREAFVEQARRTTSVDIEAVESAEQAAQDVDILLSATSSLVPTFRPEWLRPGMHVGCIKIQEVDQAVLSRCDRVAVHNKIQVKEFANILPGTLHVRAEDRTGWWDQPECPWTDFLALSDLVSGRAPGRTDASQITCFVNNTGFGLQFAALGVLLLDKARDLKVGTDLPAEWFSETVHP